MSQTRQAPLPRTSTLDTLRTVGTALVPIVAQGVIARRPKAVALAGRVEADRRTVVLLQRLRERYGTGPLRLKVPGRSLALLLSEQDVRRVLDGSPEPFALSTAEKRGALTHFQPHGVLVSHGSARGDRRCFNEEVLDTGAPVHALAPDVVQKVTAEARIIRESTAARGVLTWQDLLTGWRRGIRRTVLGDAARDDTKTSDLLTSLRYDANWSYLHRKREHLRDRLSTRLRGYVDAAEPGSLAGAMSEATTTGETAPIEQIPQWLFASDPAAMVAHRALALLATHSEHAAEVRAELRGRDLSVPQDLPLLRACVLESVRLWPTTAVVLRESTTETSWDGANLPAGTSLLIISSFFHRDEQRVPQANRFDPHAWSDGRASADWSLFPFSGGPGRCPGRELVLFLATTFLATLLDGQHYRRAGPETLDPRRRLPCDLDPFQQRFTVRPRQGGSA